MAELDIEVRERFRRALAGALVGWEDVDGHDLRGSRTMFAGILHRLEPFIAALEDRGRLRAAGIKLLGSSRRYERVEPKDGLPILYYFDEQAMREFRSALEGRDG